ncbi:MAG: hypothetical protein HFG41_09455 [Coprococcus sp.]|nr:hypothetical protein [Coprococcus sp.]
MGQKIQEEKQEMISMEEYLRRRRKIMENEEDGAKRLFEESGAAWLMAALYG